MGGSAPCLCAVQYGTDDGWFRRGEGGNGSINATLLCSFLHQTTQSVGLYAHGAAASSPDPLLVDDLCSVKPKIKERLV